MSSEEANTQNHEGEKTLSRGNKRNLSRYGSSWYLILHFKARGSFYLSTKIISENSVRIKPETVNDKTDTSC